jgi:hypothetical protein
MLLLTMSSSTADLWKIPDPRPDPPSGTRRAASGGSGGGDGAAAASGGSVGDSSKVASEVASALSRAGAFGLLRNLMLDLPAGSGTASQRAPTYAETLCTQLTVRMLSLSARSGTPE